MQWYPLTTTPRNANSDKASPAWWYASLVCCSPNHWPSVYASILLPTIPSVFCTLHFQHEKPRGRPQPKNWSTLASSCGQVGIVCHQPFVGDDAFQGGLCCHLHFPESCLKTGIGPPFRAEGTSPYRRSLLDHFGYRLRLVSRASVLLALLKRGLDSRVFARD